MLIFLQLVHIELEIFLCCNEKIIIIFKIKFLINI